MARIRTIKPDFWTDEDIVELDFWLRLLFIGLWNFADDQGYQPYSPKRIKMQVFPADDVDINRGLARLLEKNFIEAYDVIDTNGGLASPLDRPGLVVLRITEWDKHQKISNPGKPRYDVAKLRKRATLSDSPIAETLEEEILQSPLEPSALLGKGSSEGNRKGGEDARERAPHPPTDPEPLPRGQKQLMADALIEHWNRAIVGTSLRSVDERPASFHKVMAAIEAKPDFAWWDGVFAAAIASDWLMGRQPGRDGRFFSGLTLWWVLQKADEIAAGSYDNPKASAIPAAVNGARRPPSAAETRARREAQEAARA